jgi:DNA processing protein
MAIAAGSRASSTIFQTITQRARHGHEGAGVELPVPSPDPAPRPGAPDASPELDEVLAALSLSRRPGVGAAAFRRLLEEHGSPTSALRGHQPVAGRAKSGTRAGLEQARALLEEASVGALYLGGPGYPPRLLSLGEPPPVLFVRGNTDALRGPCVAVVGSRETDEEGGALAAGLASASAAAGLVVVSGGARGVDAAAHRGALRDGGETVAVLGTGIDVAYPAEHRSLFDDIAACGALVTELLPGAPPMGSFFLTRNRIIAALSLGVVVARGSARSGALTTARWAARLGRPVAVLPARSGATLGEAGALLSQRGAVVLSTEAQAAAWLRSLR